MSLIPVFNVVQTYWTILTCKLEPIGVYY